MERVEQTVTQEVVEQQVVVLQTSQQQDEVGVEEAEEKVVVDEEVPREQTAAEGVPEPAPNQDDSATTVVQDA